MRENIVVILVGCSALALSTLRALDAKSAADSSQQSRAFTEALAEARRLADTDSGKAYQNEFGKIVAPRLGDIVGECTKNLGPTVKFQVVFVFAANGQLEQVLGPKDQPAAKCVGDKFRDLQLPAPPHASWPVSLSINISPENAPRLLAEALKLMETGTWEVDATISRAFKFRVYGLLAGKDFDLTVQPEDRNAFRIIANKDQLWTSFDGSKTWKLEDAKGDAVAQRVYGFVHNPLRSGAASPTLQVVKQETHDGDTWMQLRPKKSDKKKSELQQTEYWIAISQDAKRNGVRRYEGPVTEPGHEKAPLHCVATYQPTNDKTIQPPATANALPEQQSEQSASPDTKFVADNLKYSRDFYSNIHFVAIATLPRSFAYDRYPADGPERIRCDDGTFARKQHEQPWLKSDDWGETGKPVDKETARKLEDWVKLVDAALNVAPASVKLTGTSEAEGRIQRVFEAPAETRNGSPIRLTFGKPTYDKSDDFLLYECTASLRVEGGKVVPAGAANPVKFSFGYLIRVQGGYELSQRAWEDLHTPKGKDKNAPAAPQPKDAEAYLKRGYERWRNGELAAAIVDLSRAIDLNSKLADAYYARGLARNSNGDSKGAIGDYNQAIELDPKNVQVYNDRGIARRRSDDIDGAIADYSRAIEGDPKGGKWAYFNRAIAKEAKRDSNGALDDYNHVIELDPKNANALNNRGELKRSKGDLDGAIADFNSAIEVNSKLAVAYKNRGEAKQTKGDAAGAKEDLKHAGELNPELMSKESPSPKPSPPGEDSDENLVNRGIEKAKNGDLDGAIADFDRAAKADPKNDAPYYNRAQAKWLKKDVAGAIADFTRAIDLGSTNPAAYNNRGNARAENNDWDGAIADYTRAIELKPDYARAYYNRAVVKKDKGDTTGAEADFKTAKKLDPELVGEESPADSKNDGASGATTVSLLDGKLKLDIPSDFSRDPDDPKEPKTLAKFSGPDGAWGTVLRGTHGLTPEDLSGYLKKRVAEYSKGLKWLPKGSHLQWLKKDIVTIDGRKWADWSFVPILKGKKDYSHNPVYTRNLTTSYKGQLSEINFTSNLNTNPELKKEIDHIMDSVHLEE
jgi:tetratricopeptide (TPR) repeat protein